MNYLEPIQDISIQQTVYIATMVLQHIVHLIVHVAVLIIVNFKGHECSICFRSKQVEYVFFNRTESPLFKPKQINL